MQYATVSTLPLARSAYSPTLKMETAHCPETSEKLPDYAVSYPEYLRIKLAQD
jgi:hypothetical protein